MKYLMPVFLSATLWLAACKEKGCTDVLAVNYNYKADKDDGSCVYKEVAAGKYRYDGNLTIIVNGSSITAEYEDTITVVKGAEDQLEIPDFFECTYKVVVRRVSVIGGDKWNLVANPCNFSRWDCYYENNTPQSSVLHLEYLHTRNDGVRFDYSGQLIKIE